MMQTDAELIATRKTAEWRIRKHLKKEAVLLESFLFQNCARGLRPSDWRELIEKLCAEGVLVRGLSAGHGKPTLSFAQLQSDPAGIDPCEKWW